MTIHTESHPLQGRIVKIDLSDAPHFQLRGTAHEFEVEDWWDRLTGKSWLFSDGNPAAMVYAIRIASHLPIDDEVVYGKIGGLGHIIHVSEIVEEDS